MAPPVISGFNKLFTYANFESSAIFTNVTTPTLTVDLGSQELETEGNAGNGSPFSWIEIELEGAPLDLSAATCEFFFEQNWSVSRDLSIGFSSGAAADTDWKVWRVAGGSNNTQAQHFIDPTADSYRSSGTFDPSDVRRFRYQWRGNQSGRFIRFYDEPIWISKNPGLIAVGGDSSNPINIKLFGDFFSARHTLRQAESTGLSGSDNYQGLPCGCSIGDGASAQFADIQSSALITPETSDLSSGTGETIVAIVSTGKRVNTSSAEILLAYQVIGNGEFEDASPVANTYQNFFSRDCPTIKLGISNYQGIIFSASQPVTGGDSLQILFGASSAIYTYEWNGSANLSGSTFDSSLSSYSINFDGLNFDDGATFDASDLNFVSLPSVNKFRLDASGKTLNFFVGTAGLTAADVDVIAGTLNVVANQLTLSITTLPVGAEVRIYDLDDTLPDFGSELTGVESLTSTSFNWIHSKAGDRIYLQIFADGFKEYGETITLLSVSQTIEPALEAEDAF